MRKRRTNNKKIQIWTNNCVTCVISRFNDLEDAETHSGHDMGHPRLFSFKWSPPFCRRPFCILAFEGSIRRATIKCDARLTRRDNKTAVNVHHKPRRYDLQGNWVIECLLFMIYVEYHLWWADVRSLDGCLFPSFWEKAVGSSWALIIWI